MANRVDLKVLLPAVAIFAVISAHPLRADGDAANGEKEVRRQDLIAYLKEATQ